MHPQVTAEKAGDCPICRMALEAREAVPEARAAEPVLAAAAPETLALREVGSLRAYDAVSRVKPYEISLEMRGSAWIEGTGHGVALLHRDEAALVAAGERGTFYPAAAVASGCPAGVEVRVADARPQKWDGATALVRFEGAGGALAPGAAGSLKLATRLRRDLVVRESAILRSPEGPYVLVVSKDRHTLTRRPVEIGNVIYGYATIVSGLREDEYVAAKRTFFLDAERRRAAGAAL